jgi:hypothetical protein
MADGAAVSTGLASDLKHMDADTDVASSGGGSEASSGAEHAALLSDDAASSAAPEAAGASSVDAYESSDAREEAAARFKEMGNAHFKGTHAYGMHMAALLAASGLFLSCCTHIVSCGVQEVVSQRPLTTTARYARALHFVPLRVCAMRVSKGMSVMCDVCAVSACGGVVRCAREPRVIVLEA